MGRDCRKGYDGSNVLCQGVLWVFIVEWRVRSVVLRGGIRAQEGPGRVVFRKGAGCPVPSVV